MARMPWFAARPTSLCRIHPSLTLLRRRIGRWWTTRVGGILAHSCFKSFQAFEESEYHQTHTHRGLMPIVSWYTKALWQGCEIKLIAHNAVSSCLVSPSLSQNL